MWGIQGTGMDLVQFMQIGAALERWWGPPTHPATFEKHDLTPGGEATYFMTGPEGAMWGAWRVRAVDPPTSLEFINAFADTDGRRSWTCRSSRSEPGSSSATAAHRAGVRP